MINVKMYLKTEKAAPSCGAAFIKIAFLFVFKPFGFKLFKFS